jgi:serine/threonine protein kinase
LVEQDVPFERIGGYRILRRLATGGTSDVLLARAEGPHGFERTVVLKLLLQQFRRDAPMEKMFAREAAAYARLSHPAIVKLYDFFSAEGQLVMVLEFIDGLPLNRFRAMLRKGGEQLDDRASIFVASRVFAALAAAHGARDPETGEFAPVIHRDVNPSNVLIPWDGHVKLADFGIAKVAGVSSDTQAGFIKGTYGYMAPEQVRGEPVTVRTDVYAASLLLWELLARRKAIQRGALPEMEVLRAMAEPSLPSLDVLRPDLPQRLREAIARGLESSPDARSVTADEMLIVLRESVTSNEGRNVLAELLGRAKQENDLLRSGPPPNVSEGTATASSAPRAVPTPRPPPASQSPPKPKAASQPSITDLSRTALGIGQVPALAPTGGARAVAAPPPSTRGALPKSPAPALRPVMQMPTPAEGVGMYRSVTGGGRPAQEERVMTALGVAPPPPHVLDAMSSIPPALAGSAAGASSLPPIFGASTAEESLPPAFGAAPSTSAVSPPSLPPLDATMRAPTPPPPPPPAAVWAALLQSEQQAISIAPTSTPPPAQVAPIPTPPPPPPPLQMAPAPAAATVPMRGFTPLPQIDRGTLEEIQPGTGSRAPYALIAGILLVGSAALVAALFFAHRTPDAASMPAATATATATATAPPTPAATATATAAPAAAATATVAAARPSASYEGTIVTPAKSRGHRIFVDGRYAGDSPGPISVRCGTHSVKIGSGGTPHPVDVPCGSEIMVTSH